MSESPDPTPGFASRWKPWRRRGGEEEREGEQEGQRMREERERGGGKEEDSVGTQAGVPSTLTAGLPGAPRHTSMWGLASEMPKTQEQPQDLH